MMQEVLTILTVGLAVFYLGKKAYRLYFDKKHACEGCAVMKMRQAALERSRK